MILRTFWWSLFPPSLPAEGLRVRAPAWVHHGFVVLVLLVLGQARQCVALPECEKLVLGPDSAWRPVEGRAGVVRLARQRVWVGGRGDVDARPRAIEGQRPPGSQSVLSSEGQVMLRGVEGGRSVGEATFGTVVAGVLVKFSLCFRKRHRNATYVRTTDHFLHSNVSCWLFYLYFTAALVRMCDSHSHAMLFQGK